MKAYEEQIKLLENAAKPADLVDSYIFSEAPAPLRVNTPLTPSQEALLSDSKKVFFTKRPAKRSTGKQSLWNVDMSSSAPGYFDDSGNFILDVKDKVATMWLVRQGGEEKGPLSSNEVKKLVEAGELRHAQIKRTFDRGYVEADKLMAEVPSFYYARNINKFFSDNIIAEQRTEQPSTDGDDFYSSTVAKTPNPRLHNFLSANNITASPDFLVRLIKNKTKSDAVSALHSVTGLEAVQNTVLVELLVKDAKTQILSDVDKDGFFINNGSQKGRRSYRK